mgnify:CR=1 FL=1
MTPRIVLLLVVLATLVGCKASSSDTRPEYHYQTVVDDANWTVLYTPLEQRGNTLLLKSLWVEKHNPKLRIEYLEVRFTDPEGNEVYHDYFWPEATPRFAQIPNIKVLTQGATLEGVAKVKSSHSDEPLKFPLLR